MKFSLRSLAAAVIAFSTMSCSSEPADANPIEVGKVSWSRDYDAAVKASKNSGKPIFLLFQEIPGCAGCKQFGQDVLSDASVVDEIEANFVPLLIHNNKQGKDADILKKFSEPAWNFQVVRFINSEGRDLIPRKDRVWDTPALKSRMAEALKKAGPPKKQAANTNHKTQRVAFSQYCFWTGEMTLGAIDGVTHTEAGFLDGHEVTLVDYDAEKISLANLTAKAKAAGAANETYTSLNGYRKAPASDQKRQLQGTKYAKLNLTPEQATKVNAFVRTDPAKAEQALGKQ
jgi:hypothetical protein